MYFVRVSYSPEMPMHFSPGVSQRPDAPIEPSQNSVHMVLAPCVAGPGGVSYSPEMRMHLFWKGTTQNPEATIPCILWGII